MKRILFALLGAVSMSLASGVALAGQEFPKTYGEFEKLTFQQMKSLPDVKWDLKKKATDGDLKGKSETEIVLMRNSIYAQHGFRFSQKSLANYFLGRSWYKPVYDAFEFEKMNNVSRENVKTMMQFQASLGEGEGKRGVASESDWTRSQIAYNLFLMGFCTYDVSRDPKGGMIVFEPGGAAKVFHSRASRAEFAPYAYDGYLDEGLREMGKILIDATWSIEVTGRRARVLLEFPQSEIDRYAVRDESGKITGRYLEPGKRQVLEVNLASNNPYPFVRSRNCTMARTN